MSLVRVLIQAIEVFSASYSLDKRQTLYLIVAITAATVVLLAVLTHLGVIA